MTGCRPPDRIHNTHYQHEGEKYPIFDPTALAIDAQGSLYVLVGSKERAKDQRPERSLPLVKRDVDAAARKPLEAPRKLIKLKSWKEPRLLAVSGPLHPDVLQVVVDAGVSPPLVWVANAPGPGSLTQLAGSDLSVKKEWGDSGETLSCPRQSGDQPILNIDPQTSQVYVEEDSNHRLKQFGTVYRMDQEGNVLKKWPSLFFDARGVSATSSGGNPGPPGKIREKRVLRGPSRLGHPLPRSLSGSRGNGRTLSRLEDAEFSPHRHMVRYFEGLVHREAKLGHEVKHAGTAGVFGGRPSRDAIAVRFAPSRRRFSACSIHCTCRTDSYNTPYSAAGCDGDLLPGP